MSKFLKHIFVAFAAAFTLMAILAIAMPSITDAMTNTTSYTPSYSTNTTSYTPSYSTNTSSYTPSYSTNTTSYTPSYSTNTTSYTPSYSTNTSSYTPTYNSYVEEDWLSCGYVGCGTYVSYNPPPYNPPACTHDCNPKPHCTSNCSVNGLRECSGNGYKECKKASDGCMYWSNATACSANYKCVNGSCIYFESCKNECNVSGQRVCDGNGYKECGNYDSDKCLEWSLVTNCDSDEKCSNGSCRPIPPTCTDECSTSGERKCDGNGYKQCGNYDSDKCLEWSSITNCGAFETCSNGSCHSTCQDECNNGQRKCIGTTGWTCGIFSGKCASWGNSQSCDSRCYSCGDGKCDSACGETKSSCSQDCGHIDICKDTLSGSPTNEEKNQCANAGGKILCGNGWCKCNCEKEEPTVDLRVEGKVECGKDATLIWTSDNADSCKASGGWSGTKSTSGSEIVGDFTGSKTFKIICTGDAGSDSDSVTIKGTADDLEVNAGPDEDVDAGESVRLSGSVDGDEESVRWSCTGGTLSDRNTLRPNFTAPDDDDDRTYTCTLTATNDCGSDSDTMKVTVKQKTSNFNVSLAARPKTDCAPLNDVDLVATLSNYGNNDYDYTYYFDCENDGDWDKTVTTDATSYTATNLCDYRNDGSYTAKVKVTSHSRNVTDTANVRALECEKPRVIVEVGQVGITKNVRNVTGGTNYQGTVAANPGDTVSYKIIITGIAGEVDNVMVSDSLPGGITNIRDLQIDGTSRGGSLSSSINLGSLANGQTRTITYNATVAGEYNFSYGQTTLTNTATVTADGESANSSAAIQVYRRAVQGATTVSTGFGGNVLAGIGIGIAGIVLSLGWLLSQVLAKRKMTSEELLARKISSIKQNNLA